jgi:hypothetical protein
MNTSSPPIQKSQTYKAPHVGTLPNKLLIKHNLDILHNRLGQIELVPN